jgi:hypothetical protein
LGLPLKLRPKENLIPYTRSNYAGRPIYQIGISFFKVALLISYLRLFKGTNHINYRRVVWVAIVAVVAGHLGCALTLILACTPVSPVQSSRNPRLHASEAHFEPVWSDADIVRPSGTQIVGPFNTRHVPGTWPLIYSLCHRDDRVRRSGGCHSHPRAAAAQGQSGQEDWSHCHFPTGSLHDALLGLPVSADRQDPVWRRQLDHAHPVGCD